MPPGIPKGWDALAASQLLQAALQAALVVESDQAVKRPRIRCHQASQGAGLLGCFELLGVEIGGPVASQLRRRRAACGYLTAQALPRRAAAAAARPDARRAAPPRRPLSSRLGGQIGPFQAALAVKSDQAVKLRMAPPAPLKLPWRGLSSDPPLFLVIRPAAKTLLFLAARPAVYSGLSAELTSNELKRESIP